MTTHAPTPTTTTKKPLNPTHDHAVHHSMTNHTNNNTNHDPILAELIARHQQAREELNKIGAELTRHWLEQEAQFTRVAPHIVLNNGPRHN